MTKKELREKLFNLIWTELSLGWEYQASDYATSKEKEEEYEEQGRMDVHLVVDQLLALIDQYADEARIDEVERLVKQQADFKKAQHGHIRNNNRWPNTRGAGEATNNVLRWLEDRLESLKKEETCNE